LLLLAAGAQAQEVAPGARVRSGVLVRQAPQADAPVIDALAPGETAPLVGEVARWRIIRLPGGQQGYVSKSWTVVLSSARADATLAGEAVYRIHAVDVGTGLAVFVEGPDFALVYDAGSNDDRAEGAGNRFTAYLRFVKPELRVVDHVVLSHAHEDHVGLMPDVFDAYAVRHVWDSGRMFASCVFRDFLEAVAGEPDVTYHDVTADGGVRQVALPPACRRPARTLQIRRGAAIDDQPVRLGQGAWITFLHRDAGEHADPNENSLVARLDLGGVRVLLTGDAEAGERLDLTQPPDPGSTEALLLNRPAELRADIQFAGHHGSKTSSRRAFLDAVGARLFVISSGPMSYSGVGLPDREVVAELERRGQVWRTDVDDAACARNRAKIGRDADRRPGGCDNVLITIQGAMISAAYVRTHD
jgi:competence protein ComEC